MFESFRRRAARARHIRTGRSRVRGDDRNRPDRRYERLVRARESQQRQGGRCLQLCHQRRRTHRAVDARRRQQPAVAVRGLGRRLLPLEVTSLGQGARRLPVVHRRECADRPVDGPQRHQPAIPARELRQRLRPADQPPQQQGALRAGRLDRERREHRADDGHQQRVPAMAARAPRRHDTALRRHAADDDSLELERRAGGTEARLRASRHRGDQGLHGSQAQRRLAGVRDDGQSFAGLEPGALLFRGLAAGERGDSHLPGQRRRSVAATGPRRTSSSSRRRACGTWSTRPGCLPTRPAPTRAIHARGRRRGTS